MFDVIDEQPTKPSAKQKRPGARTVTPDDERAGDDRRTPWPRSVTILLGLVGLLLAAVALRTVLSMPDLPWHPARDLELRATYDAYRETGVLLVKPNGTGSSYTTVQGPGGYAPAAWDDDPGAYILASLLSHVTGSASPYPGLRAAMALLCAAPLTVLPFAVARVFRRARAGYALLALPLATWLLNGTVLLGTQYGLSDAAATLRVYAQYGLTGSLVLASLTLVLLLSTARLRARGLVVATIGIGVLAGMGNLFRTMSGIGVAASVGVLWWLATRRRARWWAALGGALVAVVIAFAVPSVVMKTVQHRQTEITGLSSTDLPAAHALWHAAYLGLSYPQPITGTPSPFGIPWSDEYGWAQARAVDPDVVIQSVENDRIMKTLYFDEVKAMPVAAVRLYAAKMFFTVRHFGAMIVAITIGLALALLRAGPQRRRVWATVAIAAPAILVGLIPAVLVMPLLYYYSELSGALGLLTAVALGGLAWALTSMPSYARAVQRRRVSPRLVRPTPVPGSLGVVVATGGDQATTAARVETLTRALGPQDEVLVVDRGGDPGTTESLESLAGSWLHDCRLAVLRDEGGLGAALATGVLASRGARLLVTSGDLPLRPSDLSAFRALPAETSVAIAARRPSGDLRAPGGDRRGAGWRTSRWLRSALLYSRVGDSRGPVWVDGTWCRTFAAFSREQGDLWTTELVLAAESEGLSVVEVPVGPSEYSATARRSSLRGAFERLWGLVRLALQKDDYGAAHPTAPGDVASYGPVTPPASTGL